MVSNNMIKNCRIGAADITNTHTTLGPKLSVVRGKTLQQKLDRLVMDYVDVPKYFLKLHKFVTLGQI